MKHLEEAVSVLYLLRRWKRPAIETKCVDVTFLSGQCVADFSLSLTS